MHSKVKQLINKKLCSTASCIEAKDGTILMEKKRIPQRCEEYVNELFDDCRREKPCIKNTDGLPILKEELRSAVHKMSREKAAGPDGIYAEFIEALDEVGIEQMTNLANEIYDRSKFPAEMCKSIFITLPKISGTSKCELHRTISLISHVTKLILRILLERFRGRTAGEIAEEQYGFTPDKGTCNAIFLVRMLTERAIEMQHDVYVCFIDYSKAFDTVQHVPLFEILSSLDVDGKDIEVVKCLYWSQQAAVRIVDGLI